MNLNDVLQGVRRLFLDSAPVIYFVEQHPRYSDLLDVIFDRVRSGDLTAVTGPVTLAECLVAPYRLAQITLQQEFYDLIVRGRNTSFATIDETRARRAASLRARHNLSLPDALQVATAIAAGCDALLTNDAGLRRVTELGIVVLDDLAR